MHVHWPRTVTTARTRIPLLFLFSLFLCCSCSCRCRCRYVAFCQVTLNEEIYDYIVAAVKAWRARIAKHRLKRAQKLAQVGVRMRDADGVF